MFVTRFFYFGQIPSLLALTFLFYVPISISCIHFCCGEWHVSLSIYTGFSFIFSASTVVSIPVIIKKMVYSGRLTTITRIIYLSRSKSCYTQFHHSRKVFRKQYTVPLCPLIGLRQKEKLCLCFFTWTDLGNRIQIISGVRLDASTTDYVYYKIHRRSVTVSIECQPKSGLQMSLLKRIKSPEYNGIIEWIEVGKESNQSVML